MKAKLFAAVLAFITAAGILAGCKTPGGKPVGSGGTSGTTAAPSGDGEGGRKDAKDTLPEKMDFGGSDVVFHARGDNDAVIEIYVEEDAANDRVSQAVWRRNQAVNERLNVKIKVYAANGWEKYGDSLQELIGVLQAGDDDFDVIAAWMHACPNLIPYNVYADLTTVKYLDLEKPWWSQQINDTCNINGHQYLAAGEISTSYINCMMSYVFNKRIAEEYGNVVKEDLYDVVRDGRWTIDYIDTLTAGMYTDLNSNHKEDGEDFYGIVHFNSQAVDAYVQSFEFDMLARDGDGRYYFDTDTEKLSNIVDKVYKLVVENQGTFAMTARNTDFGSFHVFTSGRALFNPTWLWSVENQLNNMEDEYGLLPYPKYDETQEDYATALSNGLSVMSIPNAAKSVDMSAAVLEAMCAESYRNVTEEYYETVLKGRYTHDEDSKDMLDLMTKNIRLNFEVIYNNLLWTPQYVLRIPTYNESKNFASWWGENYGIFDAKLNDLMDELYNT